MSILLTVRDMAKKIIIIEIVKYWSFNSSWKKFFWIIDWDYYWNVCHVYLILFVKDWTAIPKGISEQNHKMYSIQTRYLGNSPPWGVNNAVIKLAYIIKKNE